MRSHRTFAVLVVAAVLASAPGRPRAATGDILPFQATEKMFANGLKVIVVPTGFPNLVSIEIPVQVGSRNEIEPGKSGFAHFFEHLMFRGTPDTPPEKFRAIMAKAGARDNAGTGDDRTHYYATFAKQHLDQLIALYADMFQHLSYSEADFKTEARAILGEYDKNSADPTEKLFEVQRDRFFQVHTYKHTTMGFINDIENMPNEYEYSKLFFERWYRPQDTTVIVAGDVTADQVLPLVEKYWGGWKGGAAAPVDIPKEPASPGPRYAHVPWSSSTLPYVTVAFPSPAFGETSKESAAMEILAALYFGPTSGQLFQRIREIRGINYGDYAYIEAFPRGMFQFFPDPNVARQRQIFEIWIRPVVPVNAHMTLRIAVYELDKLIRNGLTQDDFERTRDYLMNNVYVMTAQQDRQLGYALDSQWYGIGEFTTFMRTALEHLTVDQVNVAVRKHLTARNLSIVSITKDATGLKQALVSDVFSPIRYDGEKPPDLRSEDEVIGAMRLNVAPENVKITPVEGVFAK